MPAAEGRSEMADLKGRTQLEGGRVAVPLVMLDGNMDVLLNHTIPCTGISLVWSEEYPEAVVLMVSGADHDECKRLGFKFGSRRIKGE